MLSNSTLAYCGEYVVPKFGSKSSTPRHILGEPGEFVTMIVVQNNASLITTNRHQYFINYSNSRFLSYESDCAVFEHGYVGLSAFMLFGRHADQDGIINYSIVPHLFQAIAYGSNSAHEFGSGFPAWAGEESDFTLQADVAFDTAVCGQNSCVFERVIEEQYAAYGSGAGLLCNCLETGECEECEDLTEISPLVVDGMQVIRATMTVNGFPAYIALNATEESTSEVFIFYYNQSE